MYVCVCVYVCVCQVNDEDMVNATHTEAVTVLKNMKEKCLLIVSREVLVVMPDEHIEENGQLWGREGGERGEGGGRGSVYW